MTEEKKLCDNTVNQLFPKLNQKDKEHLQSATLRLYTYLKSRFNLRDHDFLKQMQIHQGRDLIGLINMLIPYIKDHHNVTSFVQIKQLSNAFYDQPNYFSNNELLINLYLLMETIYIVSNKLFVNWLYISPIPIDRYKQTNVYINSYKFDPNANQFKVPRTKIVFTRQKCILDFLDEEYKGLSIADIYQGIYHFFVRSVRNVKWLLYEFDNRSFLDLLLSEIPLLNTALSELEWEVLQLSEKNTFSAQCQSFLDKCVNHSDVSLIKILVFFFEKYMPVSILEEAGYKYQLFDPEFSRSREDEEYRQEDENSVVQKPLPRTSIKFLYKNYALVYEFLRESLLEFKSTWYYYSMSSRVNHDVYPYSIYCNLLEENYVISYKNLYNCLKGLIVFDSSKNVMYSAPWHCLTINDRYAFWNRLHDCRQLKFNFLKYLTRTNARRFRSDQDWNRVFEKMFDTVRVHLVDLVFEAFILQGLLTEVQINPTLSLDIEQKGSSYYHSQLKKRLPDMHKTYSFLSGQTYFKTVAADYFDLLCTKQKWPLFYAVDWISQINFFHRFRHKRVMMVTGSTGQGKSSQVPKLYLYALKMINYQTKGRIICTAPRTQVAISNAVNIAREMGVPITSYSMSRKQMMPTYSGYVQYKTKDNSFTVSRQKYHILICTDGILVSHLKENVSCRSTTYSNSYDVIMIDEAHEHNVNMDIILTIVRESLHLNNSLRLSIVSATMDDDEHLYRSFYKDVHDDFIFPLRLFKEGAFTSTHVDRRFDITPPRSSTRFPIVEIWHDSDPSHYKDAEKIGLNLLKQVVAQNTEQHILFFSLGEKEVMKICETINQDIGIDSEYIALPLFRKLSQEWKNIITDPASKLHKLYKFSRMEITNMIKTVNAVPVAENKRDLYHYKKAIVVCTNIAEASITINHLTCVIDTGFYYEIIYNPTTKLTDVEIKKNSEMSRLQRKGRVGRTCSGTVYYTYPYLSRVDIKPSYKITAENISNVIYTLYQDTHFLPIDDALYSAYKNLVDNKVSKIKRTTLNFINIYRYIEILYSYNGLFIKPNNTLQIYKNRYSRDTLLDLTGEFYFIHPDEPYFNRIIKTRQIVPRPIIHNKIFIIFNNMVEQSILDSSYHKVDKEMFTQLSRFYFLTSDRTSHLQESAVKTLICALTKKCAFPVILLLLWFKHADYSMRPLKHKIIDSDKFYATSDILTVWRHLKTIIFESESTFIHPSAESIALYYKFKRAYSHGPDPYNLYVDKLSTMMLQKYILLDTSKNITAVKNETSLQSLYITQTTFEKMSNYLNFTGPEICFIEKFMLDLEYHLNRYRQDFGTFDFWEFSNEHDILECFKNGFFNINQGYLVKNKFIRSGLPEEAEKNLRLKLMTSTLDFTFCKLPYFGKFYFLNDHSNNGLQIITYV